MKSQENLAFEFDVCFSFAGEDRVYIEKVASELKKSGVKIFYDLYEQTNLWGKDLYVHLDEVYRHKARFCVMFISQHYSQKLWTNHERRSAQARAFSENREYILPARFDDTEVPGLPPTVGYISLIDLTPKEFAKLIKRKLAEAKEEVSQSTRLDDIRTPANNDLQSTLEKLKNYLVDDRYRIALYELVVDQREALVAQLSEEEFPLTGGATIAEIWNRMGKYESHIIPVLDFYLIGCRWSTPAQVELWAEFIERVGNSNGRRYGITNNVWAKLRLYPTLILFYASGIICLANGQYEMLNRLFKAKIINRNTDEEIDLILAMNIHNILDKEVANQFPGFERQYTPVSNHLFDLLKPVLLKYLSDERRYEAYFDRFEFFLALAYADTSDKFHPNNASIFGMKFWGPIGRFGWKKNLDLKVPFQELVREAKEAGSKWPPFAAGMFSGSLDRFLEIYDGIIERVNKLGWY